MFNKSLQLAKLVVLISYAGQVFSQGPIHQGPIPVDVSLKSFDITRTDVAPKIDGDISDLAWKNAVRRDDFLQQVPLEYHPPSEATEVYVMYDEDALYVAFYMRDSKPDNIVANVLEQGGQLRDEDKAVLIIDPFNSQRGGYQFQINANGVLSEAIYISASRPSFDWEGLWNGGSQLVEDGWTAEMAIPFKSLSFDPNNDTWGINFQRYLQREQENMTWYSLNAKANPSSSGKVRGISDVSQGVGLDIVPAFSSVYYKDHENDFSDSNAEPSVDLFYKITPQVNLALTINTDFSATEADDNSLNLSKFRRFLEEKRAFFLNDFDSFKYGLTDLKLNGVESGENALAFYSRRIGLSDDGRPVDIDGGVKLSGRVADLEFGALVMRQKEHVTKEGDIGAELIEATNAIVARLSKPIFKESKIGVIYTNGNPAENQDNSLYGVDFLYRDTDFLPGKSLDSVWLYQQSDDPDFDDEQASYSLAVSVDANEGWIGGGQYFAVEENYSPGLGFTQRLNAELMSGQLAYKWLLTDSSWIQEVTTSLEAERWNDLDTGDLDTQQVALEFFKIETIKGSEISFRAVFEKEDVSVGDNPTGDLNFTIPAETYSGSFYKFTYEAPTYLSVSPSLEIAHGDYYTGSFTSVVPAVTWLPNKHIKFSTGVDIRQYHLNGRDVYTRELDLNLKIAFNSSVSLTSQIQYDNVSNQIAFNNRLRWNLEPGQDLWVVFNQGYIDDQENDNIEVVDTSAALKFSYTLRL